MQRRDMEELTGENRNRRTAAAALAVFAAVVWLAVSGDRHAFDGAEEVGVRREGDALVFAWRSEVRAPMARRLGAAFAERGPETARIVLELNSPGGDLAEGRAVIDLVERMKETHLVDTRVLSGDYCLSMCVPIFLKGERRIAGRYSHFMFHEPTAYDAVTHEEVRRPEFERRMDADRYFRRYFATSEMDPEWGARLKAEWVGRDVWKSGRELVREGSNIVTELR